MEKNEKPIEQDESIEDKKTTVSSGVDFLLTAPVTTTAHTQAKKKTGLGAKRIIGTNNNVDLDFDMDLSKIDINKQKEISSSVQQPTSSTSRYTSASSSNVNKMETNKNDDDFFNVKPSGGYSLKGGGKRTKWSKRKN